MIEVGIPFSDPLAEGPVNSGSPVARALKNGITLKRIFSQLEEIKDQDLRFRYVIMHYGIEQFCQDCVK